MIRFIGCMVFILTNSVIAQAGDFNGAVRLESKKWVTSYAGETEVDGLNVTVNFDEAKSNLDIPQIMIGTPASTLVPLSTSPAKRAFRLNFIVSHNPTIRTAYAVEPRNVSMDGTIRLAYVSDLEEKRDFHFVATMQEDSTVLVSYFRKNTLGGTSTGQIVLSPVPHILGK